MHLVHAMSTFDKVRLLMLMIELLRRGKPHKDQTNIPFVYITQNISEEQGTAETTRFLRCVEPDSSHPDLVAVDEDRRGEERVLTSEFDSGFEESGFVTSECECSDDECDCESEPMNLRVEEPHFCRIQTVTIEGRRYPSDINTPDESRYTPAVLLSMPLSPGLIHRLTQRQ